MALNMNRRIWNVRLNCRWRRPQMLVMAHSVKLTKPTEVSMLTMGGRKVHLRKQVVVRPVLFWVLHKYPHHPGFPHWTWLSWSSPNSSDKTAQHNWTGWKMPRIQSNKNNKMQGLFEKIYIPMPPGLGSLSHPTQPQTNAVTSIGSFYRLAPR